MGLRLRYSVPRGQGVGIYEDRDGHIVDYEVFNLLPSLAVRGPKPPLDGGSFFACIGAAQTFGRFCERPFPTILSEELRLPVLNLVWRTATLPT